MTSFFPLSSSTEVLQASYILDHYRAPLHPAILMLLSDQDMLSPPCTCLLYPWNLAPFLQVSSRFFNNTIILLFRLMSPVFLGSLSQSFNLAQFIFLVAFSTILHLYSGCFAYKRAISLSICQISSLYPFNLQLKEHLP